ncbi:MAG: phage major capsid protein [Alphaproteobacteria bacterium]|nr:MAG: phage major capsid protein [Alphaproteobacteria bacterium]
MLEDISPIRKVARVETISTDSYELLSNEQDADCGWVQETEERRVTKSPMFKKQKIDVHELYAKPVVTQKLLEDAMIDLEPWLLEQIAYKMAKTENEAFTYGDGNNKPKGITTYSKDFLKIDGGRVVESFIKATLSLKPKYLRTACFAMSRAALALVQTLKDPHTGHFLFQNSLQESAPVTLLGYPIVICDEFEKDNTIIFGSFYEGYQIVDRLGFSLIRDPYSMKPFVEFYARKRVGGDVVDKEAFCLLV